MKAMDFLNQAADFYKGIARAFFTSLLPTTSYYTHFNMEDGCKETLSVRKCWLGVLLKEEEFELADRKDRHDFLDEMLREGHITKEEYERCLSPRER